MRNQREVKSMETARMKSEMEVQTILAGASDILTWWIVRATD